MLHLKLGNNPPAVIAVKVLGDKGTTTSGHKDNPNVNLLYIGFSLNIDFEFADKSLNSGNSGRSEDCYHRMLRNFLNYFLNQFARIRHYGTNLIHLVQHATEVFFLFNKDYFIAALG